MSDINKLPKWAKSEIERLRSDVLNYQDQLAGLFVQQETKVEYEPYRHEKKQMFMPDNSHISFALDGGKVMVRIERGGLYVAGDSRLSSELMVKPSSSNTFTIGFTK